MRLSVAAVLGMMAAALRPGQASEMSRAGASCLAAGVTLIPASFVNPSAAWFGERGTPDYP